jgi:hypothetical protein
VSRPAPPVRNSARAHRGLRANSFAAIVMLLLEFGLGIGVNLYATLPVSDHHKTLFGAFGGAVANGPAVLTTHALLGTLLLLAGVSVLVRAAIARWPMAIGAGAVALVALIVAWLSGAHFVGDMANGSSLAMALATAVSLLCYTCILFVLPRAPSGRGAGQTATP